MPRVFGYCRASTAGQTLTFEAQRKAISAAYEARWKDDYEFAGFFEDAAVSGAKPFTDRPEGMRVWASAEPGDIIVVSKLDRAFRKVLDFSKLLEMCQLKNVSLVFLDIGMDTSTALGKFVAQLIASVAELERHWISQRTKEARAASIAAGNAANPRDGAAGWRKNNRGKWVPDEVEREIIRWSREQNQNGVGWREIIKALDAKRVRRWNGKKYQIRFLYYAQFAEGLGWPLDGTQKVIVRQHRGTNKGLRARNFMKARAAAIAARHQSHPAADPTCSESSSSQPGCPPQTPDPEPGTNRP